MTTWRDYMTDAEQREVDRLDQLRDIAAEVRKKSHDRIKIRCIKRMERNQPESGTVGKSDNGGDNTQ